MNLEQLKDTKVCLSLWDLQMLFKQGKDLQEWEENRDELEAMDEEYEIDSPEDFGDYMRSVHDIDVDGTPEDVDINLPQPTTPKEDFVECIMRIVGGEKITYGEPINMLSVKGLSPDEIVEVIEEYDETGQFEGYIEGNGVDQDWNFDMNVKGVGVQVWGSITGGSCHLQTL